MSAHLLLQQTKTKCRYGILQCP